jgi:glycosyltransferase involved in cell wall biosynthesis
VRAVPLGEAPRTAALATHYWQTGAALALRDYLIPRSERLIFIGHPLFPGSAKPYCEIYSDGKLLKTISSRGERGPARFILELYRTVRWASSKGEPLEAFIAADSLLALAGLYLRTRGRVRRVVLYSVDFVPQRFRNPILNRIYHMIDAFCVRKVDVAWSVSEQIVSARLERDRARPRNVQMIVPHGANFERVSRVPLDQADAHRIVFLGHLLEKQGLQIVIEALPKIRAQIPNASLTVIGDGPYSNELRDLSRRLNLDDAIEFTGVIDDHNLVESRLAACGLAVAPYKPDPNSFTRFADPGKIKAYLACGLPVVLTNVAPIAPLIERRGAGRIIEYDKDAAAAAIVDYLMDRSMLERARAAATELGSEYEWQRVFSEAWSRTLPEIRQREAALPVANK